MFLSIFALECTEHIVRIITVITFIITCLNTRVSVLEIVCLQISRFCGRLLFEINTNNALQNNDMNVVKKKHS